MGRNIFLNNNVGNVVLMEDAVYEVQWKNEPDFKTILRFYKQFSNGYCFFILCPNHLKLHKEQHNTPHDHITYARDQLRSAIFKRSTTLDVLYGSTKR
jgi:hypothetical protein